MAAAHTPGPWTMTTVPTSCGVCHKVGPFPGKRPEDKPRHACFYADYPSKGNPADDELEANARLVAAAPDLLEAIEFLLCDTGSTWNVALDKCRVALAKATGSAA